MKVSNELTKDVYDAVVRLSISNPHDFHSVELIAHEAGVSVSKARGCLALLAEEKRVDVKYFSGEMAARPLEGK